MRLYQAYILELEKRERESHFLGRRKKASICTGSSVEHMFMLLVCGAKATYGKPLHLATRGHHRRRRGRRAQQITFEFGGLFPAVLWRQLAKCHFWLFLSYCDQFTSFVELHTHQRHATFHFAQVSFCNYFALFFL